MSLTGVTVRPTTYITPFSSGNLATLSGSKEVKRESQGTFHESVPRKLYRARGDGDTRVNGQSVYEGASGSHCSNGPHMHDEPQAVIGIGLPNIQRSPGS